MPEASLQGCIHGVSAYFFLNQLILIDRSKKLLQVLLRLPLERLEKSRITMELAQCLRIQEKSESRLSGGMDAGSKPTGMYSWRVGVLFPESTYPN
jgi:hypothetical protein